MVQEVNRLDCNSKMSIKVYQTRTNQVSLSMHENCHSTDSWKVNIHNHTISTAMSQQNQQNDITIKKTCPSIEFCMTRKLSKSHSSQSVALQTMIHLNNFQANCSQGNSYITGKWIPLQFFLIFDHFHNFTQSNAFPLSQLLPPCYLSECAEFLFYVAL